MNDESVIELVAFNSGYPHEYDILTTNDRYISASAISANGERSLIDNSIKAGFLDWIDSAADAALHTLPLPFVLAIEISFHGDDGEDYHYKTLGTIELTIKPLEPNLTLDPCPRCKTDNQLTVFEPTYISADWRVSCIICQVTKHFPHVTNYESLVAAWNEWSKKA